MSDEGETPSDDFSRELGFDPEQHRRAMMATFTNVTLDMLVKREDEGLEARTNGRHLSASEMRSIVEEFGQALIGVRVRDLPEAKRVRHADRTTYDLTVPLWTERGRSDLMLDLRFVELDDGSSATEVIALHQVPAADRPAAPVVQTEPLPKERTPPKQRRLPPPYEHPVPARWRPLFEEIVHRLVIKDYAGLSRDGFVAYTNDPSDETIGAWIEDYPWKLIDLPEQAWGYSEHFALDDERHTWYVRLDLWTAEEGLSDLSLEAEVHDDGSNVSVKIGSIHVM
jgi:hypothetical protein